MKRRKFVIIGIVGTVLVATALITALREGDASTLQIRAVSFKLEADGIETITFVVTNGNSRLFPWFATVTTPNGEAPYHVIETKTRHGWKRTRNRTNYSFTHYLLPNHSWEFQASLDKSERPRRVVLFYTAGIRQDQPWIHRQTRKLLKNLGLAKDQRALRSEVLHANQFGAANGSQPIRSDTNSTSSAAGSRR